MIIFMFHLLVTVHKSAGMILVLLLYDTKRLYDDIFNKIPAYISVSWDVSPVHPVHRLRHEEPNHLHFKYFRSFTRKNFVI